MANLREAGDAEAQVLERSRPSVGSCATWTAEATERAEEPLRPHVDRRADAASLRERWSR